MQKRIRFDLVFNSPNIDMCFVENYLHVSRLKLSLYLDFATILETEESEAWHPNLRLK